MWCGVVYVDCMKNAIHASKDAEHYQQEIEFMFPSNGPPRCNSACYVNTTCAVIKPHAVVDGLSLFITQS